MKVYDCGDYYFIGRHQKYEVEEILEQDYGIKDPVVKEITWEDYEESECVKYKIQYRLHHLQEFSDCKPLDTYTNIELAQTRLKYLQKFNAANGSFPEEFRIKEW